MSRLCLAIAAAALIAAPSYAGGDKPKSGSGASNRIQATFTLESSDETASADDTAPGANPRAVDLPTIALPVHEDGWLTTYVFVSLRAVMADGVDVWKMREKTPRLRYAILQAGHQECVAVPGDPERLDRERARALFEAAFESVAGADTVERIEILGFDPMQRNAR